VDESKGAQGDKHTALVSLPAVGRPEQYTIKHPDLAHNQRSRQFHSDRLIINPTCGIKLLRVYSHTFNISHIISLFAIEYAFKILVIKSVDI